MEIERREMTLHEMMKSGSDLLLDVLHQEGVQYVFGNPGTTEMPILHSLRNQTDIEYVLGLQETSVVAMADGYAKASGKPGVVNLHTAGGLGHAMGALLHSQIARTPLLVTAGQQDTRHSFSDPLLYGDIQRMAEPAAKWSREILHPNHIPALVRRGLQETQAPPRGPVVLSLPIDVLTQTATVVAGESSSIFMRPVAEGLDRLASALSQIEVGRLAIIAGDEVEASGASAELVDVADMLGAKVYGPSWPGTMPFPTIHPLWAGNLPSRAMDMRSVLSDFDGVFVIGDNPFISYLYSEGDAVPAGCKLYQLTQDATQAARSHVTHIACVGDIKASLVALNPRISHGMSAQREKVAAVHQLAKIARSSRLDEVENRFAAQRLSYPITSFVAAGEALRALGRDVAVVDEAPATMYHVRSFMERASVRRYFFMRSAILGWGLPAAVGVSLGLDRSPVVALLGDGSALYSPQALWTAAKLKVPVTFVIMNNAEYNILKRYSVAQGYEQHGNSSIPGMELTNPPIDFLALATAMGMPARRATRVDEIEPLIKAGVMSGEPNLVEIVIGTE
ncbi:thiamine pyrophosphate-binding protein [Phyllobacterium sp. CCNWLW109]|uniref:thiamine pyrophosphate-binding protein n=1 Tax=Phyllobacterium sp. CCNWLW109 TaxID=3127479 RepID=UPI003078748F